MKHARFGPEIDKLEELLKKYPECEEIESFDEQVECLERKTGRKYAMVALDLDNFAVAEILE
jgi:hypothetical protein